MNQNPNNAAVCEIELKNDRTCGVSAIGRCTTCGRAFCRSHQAHKEYSYGLVPYIDMCAPCYATQLEVDRVKEQEGLEQMLTRSRPIDKAMDYIISGAAQTALRTSGVQTVEIYNVEKRWDNGRFFWQTGRFIDKATRMGRGWLLGECGWRPGEGRLTALMDSSPESHNIYHKVLVCVRPYSEGYRDLDSAVGSPISSIPDNVWIAAAQAVKRLAGESS